MRDLVFSVGITFLTGTLIFVYFRNKMNSIDKKVNLVFNTIQEHNSRMQNDSEEEMKRFQMYHQQQLHEEQLHEQNINDSDEPLAENNDTIHKEENNLIDVSDEESEFDSSEDESDDEDQENTLDESLEISGIADNVVVNEEPNEEPNKALEILEDKLETKTSESLVDFNKLTKSQLRNICEQKTLTGWKSLNKGKLIAFLEKNN